MLKPQSTKLNLLEMLLIFILLYTIAPIVSRFISTYLTTYFYMLTVLLFFLLLLFYKGMKSFNDCIILLFPFICWKLMQFLIFSGDIILWGYGALLDLIPLMAGYYLLNYSEDNKNGFFVVLILVALAVTLLTTILGCIEHEGASRYLAGVKDTNEAKAVLYGWLNIGGYEFVYLAVLLHPLAIFAYKRGKIKQWVAILCSIAIIALSIYSEYTTALLLSIVNCLLYFFKKDLTSKQLIALVVVAVLMFTILSSVLSKFLAWLAEVIGSETMSLRLKTLAWGESGRGDNDTNRLELYQRSLMTFINNPIFGTFLNGGRGIGGHSFVLDMLGQFGLLGLLLLIFMYRTIYIKFFRCYKKFKGYGYVLWIFISTVLLSILNTGIWLTVLALFAPIFIKQIYSKEIENNENSLDC